MTLLDRLKEKNDKKYISFWGLISHMIRVDEARDDETYVSDENYTSIAEALLRLKIYEKARYFIHDSSNFCYKQIDDFEINEAEMFLRALLPSNSKKLTPTEVVSIQRRFENYFWLKESIEHILPKDYLDFNNLKFSHELKHRLLSAKLSPYEEGIIDLQLEAEQSIDDEEIIYLQRENQLLKERIADLEAKQGYLDSNNKYFSIEMKLCHETWNHLYSGNINSRLSHREQVAKYLKNLTDFNVNVKALARIQTITKPKLKLANPILNKDV